MSDAGRAGAEPFGLSVELPSSSGPAIGAELAAYRWSPVTAATPALPLVIVHGFGEHARRHTELATATAAAGHAVYAVDLPGHGKSPGRRAMVPDYDGPLAGVAALVELATRESDGRRPVLFGHSMGGAIALQYALTSPETLSGLVLSSMFLKDAVRRPAWMLKLGGLVARVAPGLPVTKLDAKLISREPSEVDRYSSDPLVHTAGVPALTGHTLTTMGARLLARAGELRLPTLALHGDDDGIADIEGARELAAAAPPGTVELLTIPGGRHELFHDAAKSGAPRQVTAAVLDFLARREEG